MWDRIDRFGPICGGRLLQAGSFKRLSRGCHVLKTSRDCLSESRDHREGGGEAVTPHRPGEPPVAFAPRVSLTGAGGKLGVVVDISNEATW